MRSKILFVDDDVAVLESLADALHKESLFEIFLANSGEAALELLARQDIDVVVSDECMAGMAGHVLLGEVKNRFPKVIRVLLTGEANIEQVAVAINRAEISRLLLKPCSTLQLTETLKKLLSQGTEKSSVDWLVDVDRDEEGFIYVTDAPGNLEELEETLRELSERI